MVEVGGGGVLKDERRALKCSHPHVARWCEARAVASELRVQVIGIKCGFLSFPSVLTFYGVGFVCGASDRIKCRCRPHTASYRSRFINYPPVCKGIPTGCVCMSARPSIPLCESVHALF